jgi:macrolide-specific efflux system membrane fusion protein
LLDAARIRGEEELKRWKDAYKAAPIIAPLDGTVIARSAEPGQTVANTNPIVVISDRLIAEARVDETDLSMIHLGQSAEIRLDAYPERVIAGTVDHINHESELLNNVNVYSINILPEEIPPMVRSGMTAHITFILDKRENVLLVPSESVAEWPQNMARPPGADFAVYTKRFAGKLQPLPVRIGQSDGRWTEIQEGLSEGMIVQIVRKKQTGATSPLAFRRPQQRDRPRQT